PDLAQAVPPERSEQRRRRRHDVHRTLFVGARNVVENERAAGLERLGDASELVAGVTQMFANIHGGHKIESDARQWLLIQVYEFHLQSPSREPPSREPEHRFRDVRERDSEPMFRIESRLRPDTETETQRLPRAPPQSEIDHFHF